MMRLAKDRLEGWGEIIQEMGISRNTIIKRGYPIHKEGGHVCASRRALWRHRRTITRLAEHHHAHTKPVTPDGAEYLVPQEPVEFLLEARP